MKYAVTMCEGMDLRVIHNVQLTYSTYPVHVRIK